jgi:formate--tetrahydrofolate ligase
VTCLSPSFPEGNSVEPQGEALEPKLPAIPSSIEISQKANLLPINKIASLIGIRQDELEMYGKYKAKVSLSLLDRVKKQHQGKLILVTAITATRAGEGKTVTSIGLAEAFGQLGVRHVLCLREPSLGPTLGIKGGAAGGGYAQVLPMEDINLHFTGDKHAVTYAHNLLAAVLDNHIFHGNQLGIDLDSVQWRRVIDLCDRQLRNCEIGLGKPTDGFPHQTGFDITAASEIMAVLALCQDLEDLKSRLGKIIVAYNRAGKPVFARDLNCVGAMAVLLRDALKPTLVQTYENTPAFVHTGPFGNIAHGCSSVISALMGLKLADYLITEAGFAAELGAEKFLNIVCRQARLHPSAAVLVASCRALKMHGGVPENRLLEENVQAVLDGCVNLKAHIENLRIFGLPLVVAVNRFPQDTLAELDAVIQFCKDQDVVGVVSEVAARGGKGGIRLAEEVMRLTETQKSHYEILYNRNFAIKEKIEIIAKKLFRADGVDYSEQSEEDIKRIERNKLDKLPLCMAKTQLSLSDDPAKLGVPTGWRLRVNELKVANGAGYIVVLTGWILLMPGMPKAAAYENMNIDADGTIQGLF